MARYTDAISEVKTENYLMNGTIQYMMNELSFPSCKHEFGDQRIYNTTS